MTDAVLKMNAFVRVAEGMRVYYDCPMCSEDFQSARFFEQYRGKTGLVKGFPEKFIGPLDSHGRMPGVYIKPGYIHVQFEGEEKIHYSLNLNHFVLLDAGQTVVPAVALEHQKVRELPEPIEFWPGDSVREADDLLQGVRAVEDVRIEDDGAVVYVLAETAEARQQRADEVSRLREEAKKNTNPTAELWFGLDLMADVPHNKNCTAGDLALVARGNVHHLYRDPSRLAFASPEKEITFWGKDGVSRVIYVDSNGMPRHEWPLDDARRLVENGEGDLVIASKQYKHVAIVGRDGGFRVRKLHACFAEHRERVRTLSLSLAEPPVEEKVPFGKSAMTLLDYD